MVVKITTPDVGGVKLSSPEAPGFDEQIEMIYGENAPLVAELEPCLVMLSNESSYKVVAYTTMTAVPRKRNSCHFRYPDAARPNPFLPRGREIFPGERRVIALCGWEIDPALEDFEFYARQMIRIQKDQFSRSPYSSVDAVDVGLDAVIFDNGLMMGPDTTGSVANLLACLEAKRELAKTLLDSPNPAERARSISEETRDSLHKRAPGNLEPLWRRLAIEDANRLLWRSDEATFIDAMKETLGQEPFVIRRA